jgi:hypothetical protein
MKDEQEDCLIIWESPHGRMTHTPLSADDERATPVRMPGVSNIVLHESKKVSVLSATVNLSDPAWKEHRFAQQADDEPSAD